MSRQLKLLLTAEVEDSADDLSVADAVMEWVCHSEPPGLVYFDSCDPLRAEPPPDTGAEPPPSHRAIVCTCPGGNAPYDAPHLPGCPFAVPDPGAEPGNDFTLDAGGYDPAPPVPDTGAAS